MCCLQICHGPGLVSNGNGIINIPIIIKNFFLKRNTFPGNRPVFSANASGMAIRSSVLSVSFCKRHIPSSQSAYNRQGSFAPRALPRFSTTTSPSDSPSTEHAVHSPAPSFESRPPADGVSQVPSQTIAACHPLSPRGAEQVHLSIASLLIQASPFRRGWPLLL